MKIIIKSKNESNHIHPYAVKHYANAPVPEQYAVQRKYAGGVLVKEWLTSQCNSKTAAFESSEKQDDGEVIELLRHEIEKRVLAGEAVKITITPKDTEGNNLRQIVLADITQGNVERLAELYNLRVAGKRYNENDMEDLGLNVTPVEELLV